MTHTLTVTALLDHVQKVGWQPVAALLAGAWLEFACAARRMARPHARFWSRPRPLHLRHVGTHARPTYRPRHARREPEPTTLPALTAAEATA